MAKTIVMCCDGTGNEFGDRNSNVVRLYQVLTRDREQIVAYYHPGVGTMGATKALTTIGKAWTKVRGLAFGYGLSENIADAYRCLMHTYEPGDKVFLFGFSRGAYTVRALCGMLQMFGLLSAGNEGLIPYAIRLFKRRNARILAGLRSPTNKFRLAASFKKTFCQNCDPHFVGLWDTVSSVGWILDPFGLKPGTLPFTFELGKVGIIRHAVSIDEHRAFFRTNLVREQPDRDIKEVWFSGVHSDVGGSYPEAESSLSKISLRWMLMEASAAGLRVDDAAVSRMLGGDPGRVPPLAAALQHNSLTPAWWAAEFWPKWTKRRVSPPDEDPPRFVGGPRLNLFRRRFMPDGASIHESVLVRRAHVPGYTPSNFPRQYNIEADREPLPPYPHRLQPAQTMVVGIHARAKWSNTALQIDKGESYLFEASGRWFDASISTGPDGYASPSVLFRLAERLRRVRRANWFALIGALDQERSTSFVIGQRAEMNFDGAGILHCFANDVPFLYRNNSGHVTLTVTRLR